MTKKLTLAPFRGLVTSLNDRLIPNNAASDILGYMVEDGSLTPRYGYRNIGTAQGGLTAVYSLDYLRGFNSAAVEKEEYLSVQTASGNTRPWAIHPTTGAYTEIKNGVSSVSLQASDWKAICFNDTAYAYNPDATYSVAKHTIGDATSWTTLKTPATPTTINFSYGTATTLSSYSGATFSGTGAYSSGSVITSNSELQIDHTASTTGPTTVTVDLGSGATQDWTYQDVLQFMITFRAGTPFAVDANSWQMDLINNDGSPITIPGTDARFQVQGEGIVIPGQSYQILVQFFWDGKTRADWDNIRKLKFKYTVTASSASSSTVNRIVIGLPVVNRADLLFGWPENTNFLQFGYTNYNSTDDFESDIFPIYMVTSAFASLRTPYSPAGELYRTTQRLPVVLSTVTASGDANVDRNRWYYKDSTGTWRRFKEQAKGTTTTTVPAFSDAEAQTFTAYTPVAFRTDAVMSASAVRGSWVVWGYKGGFQNIRHSRIGYPEKLASAVDVITGATPDLNRGATFSLRGDDPVQILEAGDGIVILGKRGCYFQVGTAPYNMTPPKAFPMGKGTANAFAGARWRSANGNPAVVFLTAEGDVYMAQISQQSSDDSGAILEELTINVRGALFDKLLTPQALTDFSTARVSVDDATDSLWVVVGQYAAVLRRQSLVDGERDWEIHKFAHSIKYLAFSTQRRMKWIRGAGQFDEVWWNSATAAWIAGATRDGGSAIPASSIYWQSKRMATSEPTRVNAVYVERDTYTNTPTLTMTSSRQTANKTLASGKRFVRFGPLQQGWEHMIKIAGTEGDAPIRRVIVELFGGIGTREKS